MKVITPEDQRDVSLRSPPLHRSEGEEKNRRTPFEMLWEAEGEPTPRLRTLQFPVDGIAHTLRGSGLLTCSCGLARRFFPGKKFQKSSVHCVRVSPGEAVRAARDNHELAILDELGRALSGGGKRKNPVGVAVNDQRRNINALKVLAEVFQPRRNTGQGAFGGRASRNVPTELYHLIADLFAAENVRVVEILEELGQERRAICADGRLDSFEYYAVHTLRILWCLQQERGDRRDEDCPLHSR